MRGKRVYFCMLVVGALLTGCTAASARSRTESLFRQHDLVLGPAERQTVVTGFFLGGTTADLAVVNIDEHGDGRLRIYAFRDDAWEPALDAALRPGVRFVDVARIGGRDRLVTYELASYGKWRGGLARGGRLNWFDPETEAERELVAVTSDFSPPPRGEILHVDITRDVNDDDLDDLVVPDGHGFWVFVQGSGGSFSDPVKIGPSTGRSRVYGADGYRYDPWAAGRVHEMDYDRDGRSDLVFWNQDHFEVHLQDARGLFAPAAETFTTEVAFDSDELASLAAPVGVRNRKTDHGAEGNMTGSVLHSLADHNGDGIADLVVFSLEGGSLWKMRSRYEVHFGMATPDGATVFAPDVSTSIRSDGIPFGMDRHDIDHDGQIDVSFLNMNLGVFKFVSTLTRAILTRSVSLKLRFCRMENGSYPAKPNATRKVVLDVGVESGESVPFPALLIGDVNGDGRSDLVVQKGRKQLRVFLGVPGPELFARRPLQVAVAMPADEEYTWLTDLNGDGKQDVLMHHASAAEPHRLTMLIAQ